MRGRAHGSPSFPLIKTFGPIEKKESHSACRCNNHANVCHSSSGKCYCTTKGVKGDQCQLCDSENRYLGNPLRGTCYYHLLIDYQFTFSLLQDDDQHYTAINFMATPEETNKNMDMSINASNNFKLNVTWSLGSTAGTISGEEFPIVSKTNIREYRDSFSSEKFSFPANPNITFHVYVSNFSWPIKIQISFSQHSSIMDLVQFFVTFFSCFLSLLLVAAVVWKVKQTCWASRRRERYPKHQHQSSKQQNLSHLLLLAPRDMTRTLLRIAQMLRISDYQTAASRDGNRAVCSMTRLLSEQYENDPALSQHEAILCTLQDYHTSSLSLFSVSLMSNKQQIVANSHSMSIKNVEGEKRKNELLLSTCSSVMRWPKAAILLMSSGGSSTPTLTCTVTL
ncbi:putative attractin-like protein 1 [Triplophysa rosa]|uniref:Attractin-like protein 1 n=1 Tax=Triplophysa rosa TaxID=992332 RepID=A0A9W8C1G4_TRIRA|nr:putative attractin-like protein 1 [Triplophysa rosa]